MRWASIALGLMVSSSAACGGSGQGPDGTAATGTPPTAPVTSSLPTSATATPDAGAVTRPPDLSDVGAATPAPTAPAPDPAYVGAVAPAPALPAAGVCVTVMSTPYARLVAALRKADELRAAGHSGAVVIDTREVPELASGMLAVLAAAAASDEEAQHVADELAKADPPIKATVRACSFEAATPVMQPADLKPLGLSTTRLAFDWASAPELEPGCHGYSASLDAVVCVSGHVGQGGTRLTVEAHRFPRAPDAPEPPALPAPIALSAGATPTGPERQAIDALLAAGAFVTLPPARAFSAASGTAWVEPKVTVKALKVPSGADRVGYKVSATCPDKPAVEIGRGRFLGGAEPVLTARVIPDSDKVVIEAVQSPFDPETADELGEDHRVFVNALTFACAGGAPPATAKEEGGDKPLAFDWSDDFDAIKLEPGCSGYSKALDAVLCLTGKLDEDNAELSVEVLRVAGAPTEGLPPLPHPVIFDPGATRPNADQRARIDALLALGHFLRLPPAVALGVDGVATPDGRAKLALATKAVPSEQHIELRITATCGDRAAVELKKAIFESDRAPRAKLRPVPGADRYVVEVRGELVGEGLYGPALDAYLIALGTTCDAATPAPPSPAPTPAPTP